MLFRSPATARTDPHGLVFTPDETVTARDGTAYLLSREQAAIYRWSTALGTYVAPIPLSTRVLHIALSTDDKNLYLADDAGQIWQQTTAYVSRPALLLFKAESPVRYLLAAGPFLAIREGYGSLRIHRLGSTPGAIVSEASPGDSATPVLAWS